MTYIPDGAVLRLPPLKPPSPTWWERLWRAQEPELIRDPPAVNAFGWLVPGFDFPFGPPEKEVLDILEESLGKCRVWVTRGFYGCWFCERGIIVSVHGGDIETHLGSCSILLLDEEGHPWVAPNLVYHYVRDKHYVLPFRPRLPSPELVENVAHRHSETIDEYPKVEKELLGLK
ncbi:MAG: hypothetical protein Q4C87_12200 [Actinomycetaceae bacterium]|nr:hypothetical protein [Actinomycetaceae bacterium]